MTGSVRVELPRLKTENIKNFSVVEDATPLTPSDTSGGAGQITFDVNNFPDAPLLIGEVTLVDGVRGKTSGSVRSVDMSKGNVIVVADSILGLFNTDRIVPPFQGTLGEAIQYYCDLVGIPNDVFVDTSVSSRDILYPGWVGNVWVKIKEILAVEQVEMALVFNRVYVRPLRQLTASLDRSTEITTSVNNQTAARYVEVYYYNNAHSVSKEVYPVRDVDPTIYQVDANETITITQQIEGSIFAVNQPVVQDWVDDETYEGTSGVYAVVGNDGLPITAAQWSAQGGSLAVTVTEDPSVIEITIRGANMPDYAPYRIAMSSGSGNYYNSLHITADAIVWDKRLVSIPTGATNTTTSNDVGVTVDSPFITTRSQAYSLGARVAQMYAGLSYTMSGTALNINRDGEGRELIQATIADFNLAVTLGTTIASFNTTWLGETLDEFNDYYQQQVDLLFENQLFGNAIGARVYGGEVNFRLTQSTTTQNSIAFISVLDTLMSDFNAAWSDLDTIADFNTQFAGYTCKDFSIVPLRRG